MDSYHSKLFADIVWSSLFGPVPVELAVFFDDGELIMKKGFYNDYYYIFMDLVGNNTEKYEIFMTYITGGESYMYSKVGS